VTPVLDDATRDPREGGARGGCRRGALSPRAKGDLEAVLGAALGSDDAATRQIVRGGAAGRAAVSGWTRDRPTPLRNLAWLAARLAHEDDQIRRTPSRSPTWSNGTEHR
jgi:hypothetical protein